MPARVAFASIGILASLFVFSRCRDQSPTAPVIQVPTSPTAVATPVPTETPVSTANIAGAWTASITSSLPYCFGTFNITFAQSGNRFEGFSTQFIGLTTNERRSVIGTIFGSTLRGTFYETLTIYDDVCAASGDFEGAVLSPNKLNIFVPLIEKTGGGTCTACQTQSITFTR